MRERERDTRSRERIEKREFVKYFHYEPSNYKRNGVILPILISYWLSISKLPLVDSFRQILKLENS